MMVDIDAALLAKQYSKALQQMKAQLEKEKQMRERIEMENRVLTQAIPTLPIRRFGHLKTAVQRRQEQDAYQQRQLTGLKSDGVPIAKKGIGITSLDEFQLLKDHLWKQKQYKLWLLWCIGTATGLRISDLTHLKWGYFFLNGKFRERFPKVEQKTGKLNNVLITPFMRQSIMEYLQITAIKPKPNDFVFPNRQQFRVDPFLTDEENEMRRIAKDRRYSAGLSQRLRDKGKEVGLQQKTSHSLRHSFANIVMTCFAGSSKVQNLEVVSALLNHDSIKTTARYCDCLTTELDAARIAVSDFLLGKTKTKKLNVYDGGGTQ